MLEMFFKTIKTIEINEPSNFRTKF
jgi:hypothetical protein